MLPGPNSGMTEQQAELMVRAAAAMTDDEIEMRGEHRKQALILELQQARELAKFKLKAAGKDKET